MRSLKIKAQGSRRCVFSPFQTWCDSFGSISLLNWRHCRSEFTHTYPGGDGGGAAVVATCTKDLLHLWSLVLCEVQPTLLNVYLTNIWVCGSCWLCCTHLPLAHKPRAFLNRERPKYVIDKCFNLITNLKIKMKCYWCLTQLTETQGNRAQMRSSASDVTSRNQTI